MHYSVAVHVSGPAAFLHPTGRFNGRFEELDNHADRPFHGKDFPSNEELLDARERVFARRPKTTFIALHAGHLSENLGHAGRSLDRHPGMYADIAARLLGLPALKV